MAKKAKGLYAKVAHVQNFIKRPGRHILNLCKMNKSKRRQFKKYNGQGR